jgi:hypothetical protein
VSLQFMRLEKVMLMKRILLFALLAAAPLAAQTQIVGQDAKEFSVGDCVNKPEATTLEQCKGEVVIIKYWGTR